MLPKARPNPSPSRARTDTPVRAAATPAQLPGIVEVRRPPARTTHTRACAGGTHAYTPTTIYVVHLHTCTCARMSLLPLCVCSFTRFLICLLICLFCLLACLCCVVLCCVGSCRVVSCRVVHYRACRVCICVFACVCLLVCLFLGCCLSSFMRLFACPLVCFLLVCLRICSVSCFVS